MKLGVFTVLLGDKDLETTFKYLNSLGVQTVELGCGGYPGTAHIQPNKFLDNKEEVENVKNLLEKYNLEISAFSVHGNPVHPNKDIANNYHLEFINACKIAKLFNVDTIVTFSGCPGDGSGSKYPNWVTCTWPEDYKIILEYQWNEVLIPYWKEAVLIAKRYDVKKIALEMHPGFCVYNPETLLELRNSVDNMIGANFDPSHLIWQGIDIPLAIKNLKDCIYHFHAKDTKINEVNTFANGVLDTKGYDKILDRSWIFRTVGYGDANWKEIISTLQATGYSGALSIEHEDAYMSINEGLEKAVQYLKNVLINEPPANAWWL